jgi:hypothetical protein
MPRLSPGPTFPALPIQPWGTTLIHVVAPAEFGLGCHPRQYLEA